MSHVSAEVVALKPVVLQSEPIGAMLRWCFVVGTAGKDYNRQLKFSD